ncbi:hypothetical protein FKM82_010119 [Ascaphus truei]
MHDDEVLGVNFAPKYIGVCKCIVCYVGKWDVPWYVDRLWSVWNLCCTQISPFFALLREPIGAHIENGDLHYTNMLFLSFFFT